METPVVVAGAVALLAVLALVLALLVRSRAEERRTRSRAQAETAELRDRLDALTDMLERQATTMVRVDDPAYVITDAGAERHSNVPDRVVLSTAVGEPLVKAVAFGHGVRRALSAESRNRIWFEVRREVRRTRKQRRREMKDAWRRMQAQDRAQERTQDRAADVDAA